MVKKRGQGGPTSVQGVILFHVPLFIAIVECENASVGGEKDHKMSFRMVDVMTHKILKKN